VAAGLPHTPMILLELHCLNDNNAAGNIVVCDFAVFDLSPLTCI